MKVQKFSDFLAEDIPEVPSLMGDGIIVPEGRIIIYGDPGTFKSFATLQLCYALGNGGEWLGYEIQETCKVMYLQAELIPKRMQLRGQPMEEYYGSGELDYVYTRDFTLNSVAEWEELTEAVEDNGAEFIFLDPMSQLLSGSEIDDGLMRRFFKGLDILTTATGAGIGLVHHSRKSVSDGNGGIRYAGASDLRGHSTIHAWADSIVRLSRIGMPDIIEIDWQKTRHRPELDRRWLKFDEQYGILRVAETDPKKILYECLQDGPRRREEVDKILKKEAGLSPRKSGIYRQDMESRGFIVQYKDPINKKYKLVRLRNDGKD